jgi:Fe-S oxidoreductase
MTRVYDLCHGCRLCLSLCPSFPTLFDAIDAHDGDVEALSAAEQDKVVDECYQCKLCYVKCPYVPPHEWQLDFPRLMLRASANRPKTVAQQVTTQVLARTDLAGRAGSYLAPVVNAALSKPGSSVRRVLEKAVGISSQRVLPPYVKLRFTTWFARRRAERNARLTGPWQARAAVFPTCLVEYQNPAVGQDLVKVYERNSVDTDVVDGAGCCGAPWLHSGNFEAFERQARKNLPALVASVRAGRDIVVSQPTCGYVLKRDYVEYLGGEDAKAVAEHTYDACEFLWKLHKDPDKSFDTEFPGDVPQSIAYHAPCHLQAQNVGLRSRDLLKLTGAKVTTVAKCSGIDGTWGLRQENYDLARKVAEPLEKAIDKADPTVVAGDCDLANTAIRQGTGRISRHPLQIIARAYGIPEERG